MPDPNERHAKSSLEWGREPPRSRQRAAAASDDPVRENAPARRKKGACKGPGGWHPDHDLAYVMERDLLGREKPPCSWQALQERPWGDGRYEPRWACHHQQECSRCGHVERPGCQVGQDCPAFPGGGPPASVAADAERKTAEAQAQADAWQARRRSRVTVNGPQGYRKPKGTGSPL